jgi:hypothetical protein
MLEVLYLKNSIFSIVLITDSKQFTMLLSCPEAQLYLCGEAIWFKG